MGGRYLELLRTDIAERFGCSATGRSTDSRPDVGIDLGAAIRSLVTVSVETQTAHRGAADL
jgi:hypothetical protein